MTGSRRWRSLVLFAVVVGACSGPPRPEPAPILPPEPAAPTAPPTPTAQEPDPAPSPRTHAETLGNGLELVVTEAPPDADAQLQLGFRVGAATAAPGLAEFGARALVASADASQGRPSLQQAIANLGGLVRVDLGASTTWIAIRVPASRWQDAQVHLFTALAAPPQSRSQLERLREQLVQEHRAAVAAEPSRAMARALLLGSPDTATYVSGLLDRDPSEVGLFQGRHFRPEHATLVLRVPGEPAAIATALTRPTGAPQRWNPPALAPSPSPPATPEFASGPSWTTSTIGLPCRATIVMFRPERGHAERAAVLALQACVTLDGTGGRLERFQQEQGVGYAWWTTEIVSTADRTAIVLTADIGPADAAAVWRAFDLARRSVRDVPPTASELELATRRVRLSTGLDLLDDLARGRAAAEPRAATDAPAHLRPGSPEFERAAASLLELPAAFFVLGAELPDSIAGVRPLRLLPAGFESTTPGPTAAPSAPTPWVDRAVDALGGAALLRRVVGWDSEGHLQSESAPRATEVVAWRTGGTLRRTRELLGSTIETTLDQNTQVERMGNERQTLDARDAALLRREFARHPIAVLAAHCAGALRFRTIAQRTVGDREMMILQAEGDRFDRLRIHIDTGSHLIRLVEVWETLGDGTTIHLEDAWSDYRSVAGLRVPFRRVTTQDEGANRVETVFTKWRPVLGTP